MSNKVYFDDEMEFTDHVNSCLWNSLVVLLRSSICKVTFIKKDGSERVIRGTLKAKLLPPPSDDKKKPNKSVVNIYDLEAFEKDPENPNKAWRSFSISSMKSIEILHDKR